MRISDWSSDVCSSDLAARIRRLDGRPQLGAVLALDLLAKLRRPVQLDEIEAELLAVDEGQREGRQPVEADAIAAIEQEVPREEIARQIGKDVDLLQLDHNGVAPCLVEPGIEIGRAHV